MNGQFNGKSTWSLSFIAWWNCVTLHWPNTTTVLVFMASPHDLGASAQPQSGSEFQFNSRTFCHLEKKKKRGAEKGWNIILYFQRNHAFGTLSCVSVRLWNKWRFWSTSQTVKFKQSRSHFFVICSASPCLLLRGVQFYLANPKLVKSKAKNYFQVQWPGHLCLQVVELWFDEFSQQRRGEPFWKTPSVPAVVTFITLYPHVFVPLRISPVEIMKPDLSSRRVSAGFTIITVEQKEPTPLCSTKRRNKKKKNETLRPR